jgi:diguanylate cyclase (GGDEF)-like protein
MFRVLTCLTVQHDWRLVSLAGLVCFISSIVAINIFHHAVASQGRTRAIWIAIAGGAFGYGIWATHFIAMLAYDPGIGTGYSITLTALSLVAAMAVTSIGFAIAAGNPGNWGATIGGGTIGAGIASMHYLGMSALEVPGRVTWLADLVIASIAFGVVFGIAALIIASRFRGKFWAVASACLLTLAIVSHHFTAMGAVEILPDPQRSFDSLSLSPGVLALAITGVALSVLGMSLVGAMADRRLASRTDNFTKIIAELSRAQQQVQASERALTTQRFWLNTAINNMSQGLLLFDASERLVVCNHRYIEMYGLSPDIVRPGCTFRDLISHRQKTGSFSGDIETYRSALLCDLARQEESRMLFESPDGRSIRIVNRPLSDGGWLATHEDITKQRQSEARISYLAHHDMLTGLSNRAALAHKIEEAAARQHRLGTPFSVLLLDLDRFKYVNDTLGHSAGDALLREVASRLKRCLRETDAIGRLGGDEFAIVQVGDSSQRDAVCRFADRIIDIIAQPFDIDGNEVNIGTSIGIALAPEHASDPDDLLKMADMALYRAKSSGRNNYRFFDTEMIEIANARRLVETELRHAIQHDELRLHFQPIVDAKTLRICGAEALVRWEHPTKGMIFPDRFIPLAEETGLITQIGQWVLQTACDEAAKWPAGIKLAVNISPVQFRKSNLIDVVGGALTQSGLLPDRLELEITETSLIESAAECLPLLRQLKSLGTRIALDDFGTGYSSLSQLTMFPFDRIKIDKSFVQNMTRRAACAAIISSTLTLANTLDIATTAEGVETAEQYEILRLAGVTCLQGYLFARPGAVSEIDFDYVYGSSKLDTAA